MVAKSKNTKISIFKKKPNKKSTLAELTVRVEELENEIFGVGV